MSDNDQVTIVGAGVTLQEAIKLRASISPSGWPIFTVTLKTIDKELLLECSKATNGCFVTVEDHYPDARGANENNTHDGT